MEQNGLDKRGLLLERVGVWEEHVGCWIKNWRTTGVKLQKKEEMLMKVYL